jgi:hypothetical protein
MARSGSGGCLKGLLIGCGVMLLLLVVGIAGVALNFDLVRQSGWYRSIVDKVQSARSDVQNIVRLRSELLELYPAEQLGANVRFSSINGVSNKMLDLQFDEPRFELPAEPGERERFARAIAAAAASRFNGISRFDTIVIGFARRFGSASNSETFSFAVSDLVSSPAPSKGEAEKGAADLP